MNILRKLSELEQYLGFNIIELSGWLYFPALIYMLNFDNQTFYMWIPLCTLSLIPWVIGIIGFIIFLIEQVVSPKATNKIFRNNIYRVIAKIGLIIILIFYILILWNILIP